MSQLAWQVLALKYQGLAFIQHPVNLIRQPPQMPDAALAARETGPARTSAMHLKLRPDAVQSASSCVRLELPPGLCWHRPQQGLVCCAVSRASCCCGRSEFRDSISDARGFGWDISGEPSFQWKHLIEKKVRAAG